MRTMVVTVAAVGVCVFAFASGVQPGVARAAGAGTAAPADGDASLHEAAKHFQQGVSFYGEADYRSALVEFRRAGALAPSSAALYNIAETEYQLRDYAGAMRTFGRYLAAVGPTDAHRAEVEGNIKMLRARVGRLNVVTTPVGAEVSVDDQPAGKTPFPDGLIVNVGHLKVVASAPDHLPVTQYVDVAAEDSVALSLDLARTGAGTTERPVDLQLSAAPDRSEPATVPRRPWLRPAGWVVAGVAAVGAIGFGLLAHQESNDLQDARRTYPVTKSHLDDLSTKTTAFAIVSDVLSATAIVVGALTFFGTSSAGSTAEVGNRGFSSELIVGPTSAALRATFF